MEPIISLLHEKILFLERFFAINEHEILNFVEGDFDNVEAFYQARDKLLDVIREIDRQIATIQRDIKTEPTNCERDQLVELFVQKQEIVERITQQDIQILSLVDAEKSKIIRELQSTAKTRKLMDAYRSEPSRPQIDEKA